jgi:hypothetical protein
MVTDFGTVPDREQVGGELRIKSLEPTRNRESLRWVAAAEQLEFRQSALVEDVRIVESGP